MSDFHLAWAPDASPARLTTEQLGELYAYPPRTWVRGSMVSSIDGSAVGPDGLSASVSSPPDRVILGLLRALADVVLVAAGTARAEGYRRTVAKPRFAERRASLGQAPAPAIAVVTSSGNVDEQLLRPTRPEEVGDLFVLTTETVPSAARAHLEAAIGAQKVISCGRDQVDPVKAVAALADRGLHRIVCEGGPSWLSVVANAGRLDELCLTTSPLLVSGQGARVLTGEAIEQGTMRLGHIVTSGDTVFTRWVRTEAP